MAELLAELIGQAVLFNELVAKSLGIHAVDLQAFGVIARHGGPITPTEVMTATGLAASSTTRVLDRLESAGFIVRSLVPADRRKIAIEVVASRAAEVAEHYTGKIDQIERLNAKRTDAEIAAVLSYLSELAMPDGGGPSTGAPARTTRRP
ncbi:MarR family winged helix-turn-helix transcriptional regulator [Frankia sp. R82]|uniref:MarR family winged helix-turn-helix transcriptional regulator n=1 Tax=Frankia sp. R82 TaxID=2950553 RepID=UPI0020448528|nr:MarR family winged helix-turn-helix transcriptional regulator [Frankia sp. R82]MCM3885505.1 MarR family winged helix-turn-helix transcriptional regulator [Frankia sp. R82]